MSSIPLNIAVLTVVRFRNVRNVRPNKIRGPHSEKRHIQQYFVRHP